MNRQDRKAILKHIGNQCRELRIFHNKTQRDLSKELNVSQQFISAFELGNMDSAILLLEYLKMDGIEL